MPFNFITGEYTYVCRDCGDVFKTVDDQRYPLCEECKPIQDHIDEVNLEIELEYDEFAEKEAQKPLKRRKKNRAGQRDISDNGYW